ncbi:hypothetical protein F4780DRAFT_257520 [Xylariomycetidae sp. FL0641]|nr:hypothetical protein F4780DRAFT_257520 [Xylariomycetidae sp. FL0641]
MLYHRSQDVESRPSKIRSQPHIRRRCRVMLRERRVNLSSRPFSNLLPGRSSQHSRNRPLLPLIRYDVLSLSSRTGRLPLSLCTSTPVCHRDVSHPLFFVPGTEVPPPLPPSCHREPPPLDFPRRPLPCMCVKPRPVAARADAFRTALFLLLLLLSPALSPEEKRCRARPPGSSRGASSIYYVCVPAVVAAWLGPQQQRTTSMRCLGAVRVQGPREWKRSPLSDSRGKLVPALRFPRLQAASFTHTCTRWHEPRRSRRRHALTHSRPYP